MFKWLSIISLILYCTIIYWLSDQPSLKTPMLFPHQDKVFHAGAYFIMAVLAWNSFRHFIFDKKLYYSTVIFCSLYGISDEWHQSFVKGRSADVFDWMADTIGAIVAVTLLRYLFAKFKSTKNI